MRPRRWAGAREAPPPPPWWPRSCLRVQGQRRGRGRGPASPEVPSRELCVRRPVVLSSPPPFQPDPPAPDPPPRSLGQSVPPVGGPRCEPRLRAANAGRAVGFLGNSPEHPGTVVWSFQGAEASRGAGGRGCSLERRRRRARRLRGAPCARGHGAPCVPGLQTPSTESPALRRQHAEAGQRGHGGFGRSRRTFSRGEGAGFLLPEAPVQEASDAGGARPLGPARSFSSRRTATGLVPLSCLVARTTLRSHPALSTAPLGRAPSGSRVTSSVLWPFRPSRTRSANTAPRCPLRTGRVSLHPREEEPRVTCGRAAWAEARAQRGGITAALTPRPAAECRGSEVPGLRG